MEDRLSPAHVYQEIVSNKQPRGKMADNFEGHFFKKKFQIAKFHH